MPSSDDLEPLVARFRPVGPPPELRARIAAADTARPLDIGRAIANWVPAAAALLLVVLFHWLATTEHQLIESQITPIPPIDRGVIALAESEPQ